MAIAVISWLLRNKSAHVRYLLWLIVVAKCLAPPLVTISLAILPQESRQEPVVMPLTNALISAAQIVNTNEVESPAQNSTSSPVSSRPIISERETTLTTRQWLVIAWITGVCTFALIVMIKALRTELWLKKQRKSLPSILQDQIDEFFSHLNMNSPPNVWLIDSITQPFVWGLIRGDIYLPFDFVKVNGTEQRCWIITHELSHIIRFDAGVNVLQLITQAIFWFHPFVWWANKRIRAEREKCCDEMVVAGLGTQAKDYSKAIVDILISEQQQNRPIPSLAVAGPVKNIEERIKTMLRPGKKFYRRPGLVAATLILLLALPTVPIGWKVTNRVQAETSIESDGEIIHPLQKRSINTQQNIKATLDELEVFEPLLADLKQAVEKKDTEELSQIMKKTISELEKFQRLVKDVSHCETLISECISHLKNEITKNIELIGRFSISDEHQEKIWDNIEKSIERYESLLRNAQKNLEELSLLPMTPGYIPDIPKSLLMIEEYEELCKGILKFVEKTDYNNAIVLLDRILEQEKEFELAVKGSQAESLSKELFISLSSLRYALEKSDIHEVYSQFKVSGPLGPEIKSILMILRNQAKYSVKPSSRALVKLFGSGQPKPIDELMKLGYVPAFKSDISENIAFDLDRFDSSELTDIWPDSFDIVWGNFASGSLLIKPDSSSRILALPLAKNWEEAIFAARNSISLLMENTAKTITVAALENKFFAILTSEGNLAVIEVREYSLEQATIYWWLEEISTPFFDPPVTIAIYNIIHPVSNYIDRALDLDKDILLSIPEENQKPEEPGDNVKWLIDNGGDLVAGFQGKEIGLMGFNMVSETLPNRVWDELSGDELLQKVSGKESDPNEMQIMKWNNEGEPPVYAFATKNGAIGLLQMLAVDKGTKKIELRYKKLRLDY